MNERKAGNLLHVTFVPTGDADVAADAVDAIRANRFLFHRLNATEYLVLTHGTGDKELELTEDLNDNAVNGHYVVRRLNDREREIMDRLSTLQE